MHGSVDAEGETGEAGRAFLEEREVDFVVAHLTVQVAGVDPLTDDGRPPVAKRRVVAEPAQVAAGRPAVALEDLVATEEASCGGRVVALAGFTGVAPIDEHPTDVGQRITERAQFPVEYGPQFTASPMSMFPNR